ncbi:hypothetical protein FHG87_012397 [Trinorchestia longiramus]|nr:hypothetical protein FHG87_012397 [Trinorchestia longiramus]
MLSKEIDKGQQQLVFVSTGCPPKIPPDTSKDFQMASNISWGTEARATNATSGGSDNETSVLNFRNFITEGNIRPLLGTNSNLSDNKILRSWQYMLFMLSYCVICSLIGILSVTLLPDPNTIDAMRAEDQQVDYDETMQAAAHNLQNAYETYGGTSYQYLSNDLAAQRFDEYGDHTNNYDFPEQQHTKRFSRSMTGVRKLYTRSVEQQDNGYTRSMEQQDGGYTRSMKQQDGGYTRSMEQQDNGYTRSMEQQNGGYQRPSELKNNGYQHPMRHKSSGYSKKDGEYNRPSNSQYRATPQPSAGTQNSGYSELNDSKEIEESSKMSAENANNGYFGPMDVSNSSSYETTGVPGDVNEEKEDEDLIPHYGFLENSLYAKYLEFYNKHKVFFEEHFGYSKNKNKKEKEEEDEDEGMDDEEEEEPIEGSYTEQPMSEEALEDAYSERPVLQEPLESTNYSHPMSQESHTDKKRPLYPPPTHWVLIPQQYRPPYNSNKLQTHQYRPKQQESESKGYRQQPQQQGSQSQRYRPQPQQQKPQSQRYRPQPQQQGSQSQRYRPQPQQQKPQSQRYRPQPQQQKPQSLRYRQQPQQQESKSQEHVESKYQQQYKNPGSENQNGKQPSIGNIQLSSHFQKVNLASDESSNKASNIASNGVAYSRHYSSVNGNRSRPHGSHTPFPHNKEEIRDHMEPTESSYLSYKPHSGK